MTVYLFSDLRILGATCGQVLSWNLPVCCGLPPVLATAAAALLLNVFRETNS